MSDRRGRTGRLVGGEGLSGTESVHPVVREGDFRGHSDVPGGRCYSSGGGGRGSGDRWVRVLLREVSWYESAGEYSHVRSGERVE